MKKLFLSLALLLVSVGAKATVRPPIDYRGESLNTIDWVGADTCNVDASFTTSALVCSSGSIIIYGVTASNAGAGDYMTFRSTNLAATTIVATTTIVYVSTVPWNINGSNAGANSTFSFRFPVPIKMTNGLSVKLSATVGSAGTWTVLYRKQTATE